MSRHRGQIIDLNGHGPAPEPAAPVPILDEEALAAELAVGETCYMNVPLSQAHAFALVVASQLAVTSKDCGAVTRERLIEFQLWCAKHAGFGPQTRALLACSMAVLRNDGK